MRPDDRFLDDLTETSTRVEPALTVDDPETFGWDDTCDVLVVGAGMAGACAALCCAEDKWLQVIAIDRGGARMAQAGHPCLPQNASLRSSQFPHRRNAGTASHFRR